MRDKVPLTACVDKISWLSQLAPYAQPDQITLHEDLRLAGQV